MFTIKTDHPRRLGAPLAMNNPSKIAGSSSKGERRTWDAEDAGSNPVFQTIFSPILVVFLNKSDLLSAVTQNVYKNKTNKTTRSSVSAHSVSARASGSCPIVNRAQSLIHDVFALRQIDSGKYFPKFVRHFIWRRQHKYYKCII
jgi:hypothetical protein